MDKESPKSTRKKFPLSESPFVSSPLIPTDLNGSILSADGSLPGRTSHISKAKKYAETKYNSNVEELSEWSAIGRRRGNSICSPDTKKTGAAHTFDMEHTSEEWFYIDESGTVQGPFDHSVMTLWYERNMFTPSLQVKRGDLTNYIALGDLTKLKRDPFGK